MPHVVSCAILRLSNDVKLRLDGHGSTAFAPKTRMLRVLNSSATKVLLALRQPRPYRAFEIAFAQRPASLAHLSRFLVEMVSQGFLDYGNGASKAEVFQHPPNRDIGTSFYSPLGVELEVTLACLRRCTYCAYDSAPDVATNGDLSTERLLTLIDEIAAAGVIYLRISGGDPLLHPEIGKLLVRASDKGLQITFATDLTTFKPEVFSLLASLPNLVTVKTTLDGSRPETADLLRGTGSHKKVIGALTRIRKDYPSIPLSVGMIVSKHNYDDVLGTAALLASTGIRTFSISPLYLAGRASNRPDLVPSVSELSAARAQYLAANELGLVQMLGSNRSMVEPDEISLLTADGVSSPAFIRSPIDRIRIDPKGRVYSAVKLRPIIGDEMFVGNATETPLIYIWQESEKLIKLRSQAVLSKSFGQVIPILRSGNGEKIGKEIIPQV